MDEGQVGEFWNAHPCGEELVGGLRKDYEEFFKRYDAFRYGEQDFLLSRLDEIGFQGKRVLEIGTGLGADAEQIIRRGAKYSGLDLTPQSVDRVKTRLELRGLPYERLEVGSACENPFDDDSFDIVYSYGVLHHIPRIHKAQAEIARVLAPKGRLIAALYAKWSLNYLVSIMFARRIALAAICLLGLKPKGKIGQHVANARETGLLKYLRMENFIHRNTDGPLNPYTKVYDLAEARKDFPAFRIIESRKDFMHAPPLPVSWMPLAGLMGWLLWVHMEPKPSTDG